MLVPYPADSRASQDLLEPLRAGLHELGYIEGRTSSWSTASRTAIRDRLPVLGRRIGAAAGGLIVAEKHEATVAAMQATATIPIVISMHADPWAGRGRQPRTARAGNVTGLSNTAANLAAKKIELLQQASPGISRVVMFSDHSRTGRSARSARRKQPPSRWG